jgi:hypothetical protein
MAIKIVSIDPIQMLNEADSVVDVEMFATLQILHNGKNVASPRVPLSDLPEGIQSGDFVVISKAE